MRLLHQEISTHFSNCEPTLTFIYFLCALVDILPILLIYCWSVKNSRNTVLLLKEKTKSSNWFCADLSIHTTTKVLLVCKCSVHSVYSTPARTLYIIESVQDFLIKLGIKPLMRLLKISIFSPSNVILRLTKIMNGVDKNRAHF